MRTACTALVAAFLLPFGGCDSHPKPAKPQAPAFQGQQLSVGFLEDAGLARVLEAVEGEWEAETGAALRLMPV
jgi:hypothetical protein